MKLKPTATNASIYCIIQLSVIYLVHGSSTTCRGESYVFVPPLI